MSPGPVQWHRHGARGPVAVTAAGAVAREARSLSVTEIVITIFVCLVLGHLALTTFLNSLAFNAIGVALVTLVLFRVLFIRKDSYAYLLIVFFCSQFEYANNQGGLFNLAMFLLGGMYVLQKRDIRETTRATDLTIIALMAVLVASNMVGMILRNPMPLRIRGLLAMSFMGFMFAFYMAGHLQLTGNRLRKLLYVAAFMILYDFAVSLNQHYSVLRIETPMLGLTEGLFYAAENAFGIFGSASANGQYAMLMLVFILPFISASAARRLDLWRLYFVFVALVCGLIIVLANMRAAALEAVAAVVLYSFLFRVNRRSFRDLRYLNLFAVSAVVFLVWFGFFVGLQNLMRDFQAANVKDVDVLISGEGINRGQAWQFGWQLFTHGDWWLGYGHGNLESNKLAWGGQQLGDGTVVGGGHLHNLYLALPMLYGWLGSAAYVLLHLVVVSRLFGVVRRYSRDRLSVVACLGFLVSLVLFLIDDVKSGNAVQTINYSMVMWIWLGLATAAVRTAVLELAQDRARRAAANALPASDRLEETPPRLEGGTAGNRNQQVRRTSPSAGAA